MYIGSVGNDPFTLSLKELCYFILTQRPGYLIPVRNVECIISMYSIAIVHFSMYSIAIVHFVAGGFLLWLSHDGEDRMLDSNDCIPVIVLKRWMPDGKFPLIRVGLLNSYETHPQCNLMSPWSDSSPVSCNTIASLLEQ